MQSRSSQIIVIAATLLGLFFGNALDGLLGALILGAISAGGAYYAVTRGAARTAANTTPEQIGDPAVARFLFTDPRAAALWLPLRIFVGYSWLEAGLHKFADPKWMDTGAALMGYWKGAVNIPDAPARPAITYEWWRAFLQSLLDAEAYTWFAKLITFGEILIGVGLIVGALVGVAAFFGAFMNVSFLLSGSSSSNPIMFTTAILLVLAWKVAGYIGLDRVLLPALGTPWHAGTIVHRQLLRSPLRHGNGQEYQS